MAIFYDTTDTLAIATQHQYVAITAHNATGRHLYLSKICRHYARRAQTTQDAMEFYSYLRHLIPEFWRETFDYEIQTPIGIYHLYLKRIALNT